MTSPKTSPPPRQSDLNDRVAHIETFLKVGREDAFITAWGRLHAYVTQQRWLLLLSVFLNVIFTIGLVILTIAFQRREPWVFFKDHLGEVVQVDPRSLNVADTRDEVELKAFCIRWVRDAFEFTPLDVKDRKDFALRFVEPRAQGGALLAMRIRERAEQVSDGLSVKVLENMERGQLVECQILRYEPMETLVVISRVSVAPNGETRPLPPLAIRLQVRQTPRSPSNGHGLLITDVSSNQR